jgi:hypothetical protein
MSEQHVSVSAVGSHFDEQVEIAALAHQYYEEEGCPQNRALEHWQRAEREIRERHAQAGQKSETHPTSEDERVEAAMHLGR